MNTKASLSISFQIPYLKKMVLVDKVEDIVKHLNDYALRHEYDKKEIIYFFMIESLRRNFFFKYNKEISDYLYFESFLWATKKELRQKKKPFSIKDLIVKKRPTFFVNLQVMFISSFQKEYKDTESVLYKVELERYSSIMYEVSSGNRR